VIRIALLIASLVASPSAQQHPDFSGKWTRISGRANATGCCRVGLDNWISVTQTDDSLTIQGSIANVRETWKLGASEVRTERSVTRSSWDGKTLVHVPTQSGPMEFNGHSGVPVTIETRTALHLTDGGLLVVDVTEETSLGSGSFTVPPGALAPFSATSIYKKAPG
jgi:hypothetical protein